MRGVGSIVPIAGILLPPAAILFVIWTRGVNVSYFDDWALVPLVTTFPRDLTVSDFWNQHNEG